MTNFHLTKTLEIQELRLLKLPKMKGCHLDEQVNFHYPNTDLL